MAQVKQGDTVQVNYTGKLHDGTIFDTSLDRHPLQFTLGKGQLIAGFEKAVLGMAAGERKTVVIPVAEAYGPRQQSAVVEVERKGFPDNFEPQIGQRLELTQEDDSTILVTVAGLTETHITLDANHPLAGKDLTFEIELLSIAG
ncbi:MAG: peptidylprolyl isomerase [Nitrospirae bacterium]|nr:peptidylprolyl isomerase [Nitrospirota bacterium]NTW65126.1 peptidylprolyl isomerase [Nitrospirota bacterium]